MASGAVASVSWKTDEGAEGTAEGKESWTAKDVLLAVGETRVEVTATDGARAGTDSVTITRTHALAFHDAEAQPDAVFVGDPTDVTVTAVVDTSHPDLDPSTVRVARRGPDGVLVPLGPMTDAGGGKFTATVTFDESAPGPFELHILADTIDGSTDAAAAVRMGAVDHLSDEDFTAALTLLEELSAIYEAEKASGVLHAARKVVEHVESSEAVIEHSVALSRTGPAISMHMKGDFPAVWKTPGLEGWLAGSVGSSQYLLASPYADEFDAQQLGVEEEGAVLSELCQESKCPALTFEGKPLFLNDQLTVATLQAQLTRSGIVHISTHGETISGWKVDDEPAKQGWFADEGPKVAAMLREASTVAKKKAYELLLKQRRLGVMDMGGFGRVFFITPDFVKGLPGKMPDSVVFNSSCRSSYGGSMGLAFIEKGAAAYVGFSEYVRALFARERALAF